MTFYKNCNLRYVRFTVAAVLFAAAVIVYVCCLPSDLFEGTVYSTVIEDRNGELLNARIATDGQWRFPPSDSVPEKFAVALTQFEDAWFRYHPGVNPVSLLKASYRNISRGRVVSGGSTLTMQVIRLYRQKERTVWQKFIECILATRLEFRYDKDEILALYSAHAPFGGNVVGLDAASWRYFGKPPEELSWGEAAVLAVLPNSPAMIHPGRNRDLLKIKRDRLLRKIMDNGYMDMSSFVLACEEPLPEKPLPLPQHAAHLSGYRGEHSLGYSKVAFFESGKKNILGTGVVRTTIDIDFQRRVENILSRWYDDFSKKGINDLAAVVIDVRTSEIISYCGNVGFESGRPGSQVDIIRAARSTGSILKPFLYCAMLQDGTLLPHTLLPDLPVNINGFSPQNFDRHFYGAVTAADALARSLNVPAVHELRDYGVPRFQNLLVNCGMTTLVREAEDYGLSLILGGAEGRLGEITAAYAAMAHLLQYGFSDKDSAAGGIFDGFPLKDRVALWWTADALKEVNRPDEMDWRLISSVKKVAWKTGTSYGFRDAWAVGITPDYAVGVWAGNASGEGVPGLTGAASAGPVLFSLFNILPGKEWFDFPADEEYLEAEVCRNSGHLKGPYCEECDTLRLPFAAGHSTSCTYHKTITVTPEGRYRTVAGDPGASVKKVFNLPPAMEWYYRVNHPEYKPLPPWKPGEVAEDGISPMEFIYPESGSTIYIPRQLDGSHKGVVLNLAHSIQSSEVFWHIDSSYLGSTRYIHHMTVIPSEGKHTVTAVDTEGNSLSVSFDVKILVNGGK